MMAEFAKKKLLFVITKSEVGGAQIHLLSLMKHFSHSYDVTLAVGSEGFLTEETKLFKDKITVLIVPCLSNSYNPYKVITATAKLFSIIKKNQYDLVHCHSTIAGISSRVAAFFNKTKCVFTVHGWSFTPGTRLINKLIGIPLEFILTRLSSRVICVSHFDFNLAQKLGFPVSKMNVIHNSSRYDGLISESQIKKTGHNIQFVSIGRFARPKRFLDLIDVISELHKKTDQFKFTFIGQGPDKKNILDKIASLKLQNYITVLDSTNNPLAELKKTDILVLFSSYESLPLVLLEAMSVGIVCGASAVGGCEEIVIDQDTGFLFHEKSQLVSQLENLIQNPGLIEQMRLKSFLRYNTDFKLDLFLEKTTEVYSDVLAE